VLLDLRTIYLAGAFTCLLLSLVQFATYATGRFDRWPFWWGLSNLCLGLGMIGVGLRDVIPDLVSIPLANTLSWMGYLLLLFAVRSFAGRPARLPLYAIAVAAAAVPLVLWSGPEGFVRRVVLMSALAMACDALLVREGWRLLRRKRLLCGGILAALFAPTVPLFALRGYLAATGQLGTELFPSGQGAPWLAVVGTAFLLLRSGALLLLAAEQSRNRLISIAEHDPLTGAMNRGGLERAMTQLGSSARRESRPLALLLIDIDHFKSLNDTHGHATGDRILRLFTDAARSALRPGDVLARHGGDEFVVMLPGLGADDAIAIANRIRTAFGRRLAECHDIPLQPTLSIGVAEGDAIDDRLETLLRHADEALYRSKRLGRDRVQRQLHAVGR